MAKQSIVALALATVACLIACSDPEEFAEFQAEGTGDLPDCFAAQFPFEPAFHAARKDGGQVGIFLRTPPDVEPDTDAVYFEFADSAAIADDEPISLSPNGEPDAETRGRIVFFASCPDQSESLIIRGDVQFDSFGTTVGDVIAGRLVDASAVGARTRDTRIEQLSGQWRFVVRRGPPHENFYALPDGS